MSAVQPESELASGQEVGEEHVAPLHEPPDEVGALRTVDGDGDRALAAVVDEEGGVERRGTFRELGLAGHPPHGVARQGLHLDDVGAEVGEDGARARRGHPAGELHDPDVVQRCSHASSLGPIPRRA